MNKITLLNDQLTSKAIKEVNNYNEQYKNSKFV